MIQQVADALKQAFKDRVSEGTKPFNAGCRMTRVVIQLLLAGIVGYSVAMILMALNAETQTHASGFLEGC